MTDIDTGMMLILRYKRPVVPLQMIVDDYLPHMTQQVAKKRAARCDLPFPAFKVDGNKSDWFVNLHDVALWLDQLQAESRKDWQNMQTAVI